jgi:hypothetical protein
MIIAASFQRPAFSFQLSAFSFQLVAPGQASVKASLYVREEAVGTCEKKTKS